MTIDNFRVIILDDINVTFEEYKDVLNPITKEVTTKWVRVGGFYGTLTSCLRALKSYIVMSYMDIDDYKEVLDKITALDNAIVSVRIKTDGRRKEVMEDGIKGSVQDC